MALITEHSSLGIERCCTALGVARASYYRSLSPRVSRPSAPRPTPARSLSLAERQQVLGILHEPRFVDLAPAQVHATLLDEGRYLCSARTMYRLLDASGESRPRRAQRSHPKYAKPELLATAPNQLWSWDITKLRGPEPGQWYALYVVMDVYSRYVVGWQVAHREQGDLAKELLSCCIALEAVAEDQLIIHADRGGPMKSKPVVQLLSDLRVGRSHSRPRVSNDNPYSESQFKTLKYHVTFPERFGSLPDARRYCRNFFLWYNTAHRHEGIGWHTPVDVHTGTARETRQRRAAVLDAAYARNPERFVKRPPTPPRLPTAVWINESRTVTTGGQAQ